MKRIYLFAIILSSLNFAACETKIDDTPKCIKDSNYPIRINHKKEMNLYGKVKKITEVDFNLRKRFGEWERSYNTLNETYKFNKCGNLDQLGDKDIEYFYDPYGRIHTVEYKNGSKTKFKYFDRKVRATRYDSSGYEILIEELFKYNKIGNLIEKHNKNRYNSRTLKVVYKYNNTGLLTQKTTFDHTYEIVDKRIFKYKHDKFFNIVEVTTLMYFDDKFRSANTTKYKYEYDERNNWITKIEYKSDGTPRGGISRSIEYFN